MGIYNVSGIDLQDVAYDIDGILLSQAYDIEGNALFSGGTKRVRVVRDDSTGQPSGYNLVLRNIDNVYVTREVVDFTSDSYNFQSFCYDSINNVFYKFDETHLVAKVYNTNMQKINEISLPSKPSHANDAFYSNGKVYFPGNDSLAPEGILDGIYVWNVSENTVTGFRVNGIVQPQNGSTRGVEAISGTADDGYLYIITRDYTSDARVHDPDDKLTVYLYNISTNEAILQAEVPWDCVYLQGAAFYDDILYVACNSQTTEYYTGITIKAIRTDTWEQLNPLVLTNEVEPESLNVYPLSDTPQLMMGLGRYMAVSEVVRFTIPYRLV